jgi:hypothetical protein
MAIASLGPSFKGWMSFSKGQLLACLDDGSVRIQVQQAWIVTHAFSVKE